MVAHAESSCLSTQGSPGGHVGRGYAKSATRESTVSMPRRQAVVGQKSQESGQARWKLKSRPMANAAAPHALGWPLAHRIQHHKVGVHISRV